MRESIVFCFFLGGGVPRFIELLNPLYIRACSQDYIILSIDFNFYFSLESVLAYTLVCKVLALKPPPPDFLI